MSTQRVMREMSPRAVESERHAHARCPWSGRPDSASARQPGADERVDREQDDQRENRDARPGDGGDADRDGEPRRISEVAVDLNMTGMPFRQLSGESAHGPGGL